MYRRAGGASLFQNFPRRHARLHVPVFPGCQRSIASCQKLDLAQVSCKRHFFTVCVVGQK